MPPLLIMVVGRATSGTHAPTTRSGPFLRPRQQGCAQPSSRRVAALPRGLLLRATCLGPPAARVVSVFAASGGDLAAVALSALASLLSARGLSLGAPLHSFGPFAVANDISTWAGRYRAASLMRPARLPLPVPAAQSDFLYSSPGSRESPPLASGRAFRSCRGGAVCIRPFALRAWPRRGPT